MSESEKAIEKARRAAELTGGEKGQCNLHLPHALVTALDTVAQKLARPRSQVVTHLLAAALVDAEIELADATFDVPIIGVLDNKWRHDLDRCPHCGATGGQCSH